MAKPEIATLVKLQEAETEIVRLREVIGIVEKKKNKLASRLKQFESALTQNREDYEKAAKACREQELEIKVVDERIVKSNETLRNVTTNKEYQVLLREVDDNKKRKDLLETHLLELMDERDKSKGIVDESEKEYTLLAEQIKAEQSEVEKQSAEDRDSLEECLKRQEEIGDSLDSRLMNMFRKISKMNNGSAVSRVRDQVCMGCFMNVPPQMYIEVQRGNELISCPQCSRILYYEKE
ncbi:MAG: nucleotide-binding protein [Desulfobacter sp.]|nr:MAG: nucleotide-binding protein [Desulfobacter sp.]